MYTIQFLPADIELKVMPGTLISDAAVMAGIEDLHLPCGGKGTCGRCLVEVVSGNPEQTSTTHLDAALAGKHLVMACQTKVDQDLVIRIPEQREAAMRVVGDSHLLVGEEYLPDRNSLSSLYRTETLTVPPVSVEEHYSDWQRLTREIEKRLGPATLTTDVWVLRSLAEALRANNGQVTVLLQEDDSGYHVWNVEARQGPMAVYGVAIDIGTTTIAVQLVDLQNGQILSSRTSYNAQISRGADVITRIDYARNPKRQFELRELVLDTINMLIDEVSEDLGMQAVEIRAAFIVGNTTMIHLLLGLPPKYVRESPYVPTVNTVPTLSVADIGLKIHSQAAVAFAPGVGSYVGGDITAGLLCTELSKNSDEVFLYLDIGTNGEIVLGNADWMVACACSAGPAFEGSGIKCGMRATAGAIEYIEISDGAADVRYDVIGHSQPVGICGSGLICLLGELLVHGVIDQSGRFNTDLKTDRLIKQGSASAFVLEWADKTSEGVDLVITEPDIENLMRTKAAIYAACSLILKNVGLDWDAISRIYIAGGFGRYIQVEDAILIGLLPDLPYDRFTYIGNSALTGAYIALLSREHRQLLSAIAAKMTYIDLSSDPRYMDSYMSALFLPHTDMGQFPSVAKRIRNPQSTVQDQKSNTEVFS
jgi:uncharacterized 2Fe-2S/4Fe-4S cluster protein (DUF4445 family)